MPVASDSTVRRPDSERAAGPRRVLFVAEAVTLAHVARPIALSSALSSDWDLTLACDSRWHRFAQQFRGALMHVASISSERFLASLQRGRPIYDVDTLQSYVRDDLALFERFAPDVVVGDFRLSLAISARIARIPYVSLTNAYWSPFYSPPTWPIPALPMSKVLPLPLAEGAFRLARPLAFAVHGRPHNIVRRKAGLMGLGNDLRRIYSDADFVAYADLEALFSMSGLPPTHAFIGGVLWEPSIAPPLWWQDDPVDNRTVYVTLGSSGSASALPRVVKALAELGLPAIVATAGRGELSQLPAHIRAAGYLPGTASARRSQLVICNGGSLTCYQALAAGVPILGIPSNLDQFLNMQALEKAGVGVTLRADRASIRAIRASILQLVADANKRECSARIGANVDETIAPRNFAAFLQSTMHDSRTSE